MWYGVGKKVKISGWFGSGVGVNRLFNSVVVT